MTRPWYAGKTPDELAVLLLGQLASTQVAVVAAAQALRKGNFHAAYTEAGFASGLADSLVHELSELVDALNAVEQAEQQEEESGE